MSVPTAEVISNAPALVDEEVIKKVKEKADKEIEKKRKEIQKQNETQILNLQTRLNNEVTDIDNQLHRSFEREKIRMKYLSEKEQERIQTSFEEKMFELEESKRIKQINHDLLMTTLVVQEADIQRQWNLKSIRYEEIFKKREMEKLSHNHHKEEAIQYTDKLLSDQNNEFNREIRQKSEKYQQIKTSQNSFIFKGVIFGALTGFLFSYL